MEGGGFRSKSCRDGRNQIVIYNGENQGPINMQDLRCYSANYSVYTHQNLQYSNDLTMKKGKNSLSSSMRSWSLRDPDLQRKKRVARYKVYAVEEKVKGSLKKSFRWIKDAIYGWR